MDPSSDRFAPSCSKEDRREVERILVSCMHDKEATVGRLDRWLVGSMVGWLGRSMFVFFGGVDRDSSILRYLVFLGGRGGMFGTACLFFFVCLFKTPKPQQNGQLFFEIDGSLAIFSNL